MVAMDGTPDLKTYLAMRLVKARKESSNRTVLPSALILQTVRLMLHLAGFAALTYGAFQFNIIIGYVVGGISCFVLSTLLTSEKPAKEIPRDPTLRR